MAYYLIYGWSKNEIASKQCSMMMWVYFRHGASIEDQYSSKYWVLVAWKVLEEVLSTHFMNVLE